MYGACTEFNVPTSLIPIVLLYFSTYNFTTYLGGVVGKEDYKNRFIYKETSLVNFILYLKIIINGCVLRMKKCINMFLVLI